MKKDNTQSLKDLVDITKVTRNEAYMMYIEGKLTREQMYDYLHERTMWLIEESLKNEDEK
tara:strand:- start:1017 stop:1196 length:180 start_codon:yes stop_codon:yes gene_type:complete